MMLVACRQLLTLWRTPVERVGMSAATILLIFGIGCVQGITGPNLLRLSCASCFLMISPLQFGTRVIPLFPANNQYLLYVLQRTFDPFRNICNDH